MKGESTVVTRQVRLDPVATLRVLTRGRVSDKMRRTKPNGAGGPMIFRTYIPSFPLNQFVDHFVYYEGYDPEHRIDRFLPDGNTEIIFDFHDGPQYIYDNQTLKEIQACHHVWASGVRTGFISIPSGKQAAMFVIYLKKGMAHPFFPVPMNEMADRVVDA